VRTLEIEVGYIDDFKKFRQKVLLRATIMDYSLCTFVTSLLILLLQLNSFERQLGSSAVEHARSHIVSDPGTTATVVMTKGIQKRIVVRDGYEVYEDGEIPHPSYVIVAHYKEEQPALDMDQELQRLRIAANTQREILVAANRMPPETQVSRMIAETTKRYMQEDREKRDQNKFVKKPATSSCNPTPTPLVPGSSTAPKPTIHEGANIKSIGPFLAQRYPGSLGIVLGVGKGDFVLNLLSQWTNVGGLYLVDPYIHIWRGYDDPANVDDKTHQLIFESLRNRLSVGYSGKFAFIRDFSHEFALTYKKTNQPAPSVVWIDANHSYESLKRDLADWFDLLANGGFIGGTEYDNDDFLGVKLAVDEFLNLKGLTLNLIKESSIWFFIKQ